MWRETCFLHQCILPKIFSLCLKNFPCVTTKFPVFSLSGKSKNQIPCFPCSVATLYNATQFLTLTVTRCWYVWTSLYCYVKLFAWQITWGEADEHKYTIFSNISWSNDIGKWNCILQMGIHLHTAHFHQIWFVADQYHRSSVFFWKSTSQQRQPVFTNLKKSPQTYRRQCKKTSCNRKRNLKYFMENKLLHTLSIVDSSSTE